MKKDSYIKVFVTDQVVKTRIGIHAHEKKPQRLQVQVELYADPVKYLGKIGRKSIIDYDVLHETIAGWKNARHTDWLEMRTLELLGVAFSFRGVDACRVRLSKPDIYKDAAGAGVEVFMTREDYKKI